MVAALAVARKTKIIDAIRMCVLAGDPDAGRKEMGSEPFIRMEKLRTHSRSTPKPRRPWALQG